MDKPLIRRMRLEDYEAVFKLWKGIDGMGMRSLDDSMAGIERFLSRNPSTCFVAETAEEIVGVILSGHDGRRGYIYHAAVIPAYRGQGLGKALVEAATTALRAEGIHKAGMLVYVSNALGNAFWESQGWERREDVYYRNKSLNDENQ